MASIKVELLDHMGSDLTVVNAARVSFDKASKWANSADEAWGETPELSDRDTKLINYLADHNHWSPFSHPQVQFRVAAPVFVARQLQKHTVGLSWNEISRRYVDTEPTFYVPETWRKRAENVKQGSSEESVDRIWFPWGDGTETVTDLGDLYQQCYSSGLKLYNAMIADGVCPEQARMVLPQSMMTEWIWTGSLYAFARVCNLRLDSHTQKETRDVAKPISDYMATLFPVSWPALVAA
jgi:thymidylate synthase (FAD)